jgi:beta-RFAP synthase
MLSFGHRDTAQFGGVGAMVEPPAVTVSIRPAKAFSAKGPLANRVGQFVGSVVRAWQLPAAPACEICVDAPPDHMGLGVGTQLGLAVAAGVRRFLGMGELPAEVLARSAGRGARSAVGTYGFQHGGLIVDAGKRPGQELGMLAHRTALPAAWRIVLIRSGDRQGLAGEREADAFRRLPPVPEKTSRELWRLAEDEMLPGVETADCGRFGEAVYQFGRLAGECFAPVQGGPFASPQIEQLVESIRRFGVPGVGQSSWGPTVFAFTAGDVQARTLLEWLRASPNPYGDITIARPNNTGAQVSTLS